MEEKIAKLMKNLDISQEEAIALIEDDKAIDKGEKLFELTAEQKKAAKAATKADSKPREKKVSRPKVADPDKAEIMQTIDDALCCLVDNVEERTSDRELFFEWHGKRYKIVLSCPRK